MQTVNSNLTTKIDQVGKDLDNIAKKVDGQLQHLENKVELLESENKDLKNRLRLTEKALRKKNFIVHGISEDAKENLPQVLEVLAKEKLDIDLKPEHISDCYRIGKQNNPNRPILVQLVSHIKKAEFLKNRSQLRGTKIFINEDLIPEERSERRILLEKLKEAKGQNKSAYIRGNKIIIEGKAYSLEDIIKGDQDIIHNLPEKTQIQLQENNGQSLSGNYPKDLSESERKRKLQETPNSPDGLAKRTVHYSTRAKTNIVAKTFK